MKLSIVYIVTQQHCTAIVSNYATKTKQNISKISTNLDRDSPPLSWGVFLPCCESWWLSGVLSPGWAFACACSWPCRSFAFCCCWQRDKLQNSPNMDFKFPSLISANVRGFHESFCYFRLYFQNFILSVQLGTTLRFFFRILAPIIPSFFWLENPRGIGY